MAAPKPIEGYRSNKEIIEKVKEFFAILEEKTRAEDETVKKYLVNRAAIAKHLGITSKQLSSLQKHYPDAYDYIMTELEDATYQARARNLVTTGDLCFILKAVHEYKEDEGKKLPEAPTFVFNMPNNTPPPKIASKNLRVIE